jgi:hypothetical protein
MHACLDLGADIECFDDLVGEFLGGRGRGTAGGQDADGNNNQREKRTTRTHSAVRLSAKPFDGQNLAVIEPDRFVRPEELQRGADAFNPSRCPRLEEAHSFGDVVMSLLRASSGVFVPPTILHDG